MSTAAKVAVAAAAVAVFGLLGTLALGLGIAVLARSDVPFVSRTGMPGRYFDRDGADRDGPGLPGCHRSCDGEGNRNTPGDGHGNRSGDGLQGLAGLHGEYVISVDGTPTTMLFQTGEVTEVKDSSSLTVQSTDGFTATYARGADTVLRAGRGPLEVGATVIVTARKDGSAATRVIVLPPSRLPAP